MVCWKRAQVTSGIRREGGLTDRDLVIAYSGVMDLVLAIIPWGIIMRLHMHTKEKIGVALAMSMGVL